MTKKDSKKIILDRDHYVNTVGVLEWLYSPETYQKIRYETEGCYKYKYNNQLHREDGPAIEYFNGEGNQYYLWGEMVTWEYFMNNKRYNTLETTLHPKN